MNAQEPSYAQQLESSSTRQQNLEVSRPTTDVDLLGKYLTHAAGHQRWELVTELAALARRAAAAGRGEIASALPTPDDAARAAAAIGRIAPTVNVPMVDMPMRADQPRQHDDDGSHAPSTYGYLVEQDGSQRLCNEPIQHDDRNGGWYHTNPDVLDHAARPFRQVNGPY